MKKMNLSLSTDFLKPVTNFFRKYTALLPSIAITTVAVLILPVMLMVGGSVKKQMETSIRTAGSVSGLLNDVPSRGMPQVVKRYMDQLEEEASQIETLAIESSKRELISYDVFPPRGTSSQLYVAFGRKYRAAVEAMMTAMHALDAPSEAEIRNQTGTGGARTRTEYDYGRQPLNQTDTTNPMIEALCLKRAQEISVYAHPTAFAWYDFWESYDFAGQKQALADCWDAQTAYWIYQDIVQTISAMNAGSDKVSSSPVKRLMGVSFTAPLQSTEGYGGRQGYMGEYGNGGGMGLRDIPNYIITTSPMSEYSTTGMPATGEPGLQSNFMTEVLTKRGGDEDVDVVHFAFAVLVDNRYVMAFMKELCSQKTHTYRAGFQENGPEKNAVHNQITILDTSISAIDKETAEHALYRYGNGAVMRLDLVCEYQFYRKGYDEIKPDPIKERLGQAQEVQDASQDAVPAY